VVVANIVVMYSGKILGWKIAIKFELT